MLVAAWILPRVLFYCWWDPGDPFLFAVLSLPGLWLIAFAFACLGRHGSQLGNHRWILVLLLAIAVWLHNAHVLRTYA